jgi:hypothetical protein
MLNEVTQQMSGLDIVIKVFDLVMKISVLFIGAIWAMYKIKEYRELKNRIQLDLNGRIYKLTRPEHTSAKTWSKNGDCVDSEPRTLTHAVEILLKFTNRGRTRFRIYNIQVGINTMRPPDQATFDAGDGHLHLTRIHTSGNLVPIFRVKGREEEDSSFYYIEPAVEQTISHLCLITEPRELLQVFAMFSLEQRRLFPRRIRGQKGLYPHTAATTFQLPV